MDEMKLSREFKTSAWCLESMIGYLDFSIFVYFIGVLILIFY